MSRNAPASARPSGGEEAVRPKVLRRPAQFSRAVPVPLAAEPPPTPVANLPALATPTPAMGRAWQEDVRFGLALIVSLFFINLVMVWLVPHLPGTDAAADDAGGNGITFGNAVLPQEVTRSPSAVTLYTEPNVDRNAGDQFDLNRLDPKTNNFSVSPKDIPAPKARALDGNE
ncbi:MAG: hypothetical protein WDN72_05050 [Alphaproteobacteria bacterium]